MIEALRERQSDRLQVVTPSETEFAEQLHLELDLCRRHLGNILEQYWESNWRHEHKGVGIYPEDHLWRAAAVGFGASGQARVGVFAFDAVSDQHERLLHGRSLGGNLLGAEPYQGARSGSRIDVGSSAEFNGFIGLHGQRGQRR